MVELKPEISPVAAIPTPDAIIDRLAVITKERALLKSLLRVARQKEAGQENRLHVLGRTRLLR